MPNELRQGARLLQFRQLGSSRSALLRLRGRAGHSRWPPRRGVCEPRNRLRADIVAAAYRPQRFPVLVAPLAAMFELCSNTRIANSAKSEVVSRNGSASDQCQPRPAASRGRSPASRSCRAIAGQRPGSWGPVAALSPPQPNWYLVRDRPSYQRQHGADVLTEKG